jgi:ribosomal protein S18 acetylase RimI-like enzyme
VIDLRVLTPDDWPLWRGLRLAALAEAPDAFGSRLADWQGDGDREERWRGRLELPGSHNLIAVLDGRPAGMASGVPDDRPAAEQGPDPAMELISMWIAPEARGRGVADLLIRAVAAWALESGAAELRLSVANGNERALALYHRHGFVDAGEPPQLMPDGVRYETVMAKPLLSD